MKRTAAILFLLAAIAAQARTVWVYPPEGRVRWWVPPDRAADETGQEWLEPTPSKLVECGWIACEVGDAPPNDCVVDFDATPPVRALSQVELDERASQQAQAEAEASQFPTPEVIVPVLNADGEPTGTARLLVDDLGNLVVVTDTASPRRPAKVQLAEFKTKRMAHAARLEVVRVAAAKGGGLPELRARVEALEALHGIGLKTDDGTAGSPGKPEDPPGKPEDPPGKPNKPGK